MCIDQVIELDRYQAHNLCTYVILCIDIIENTDNKVRTCIY